MMPPPFPAKVLQFGAGNFLRAFLEGMVQGMNDRVGFAGSVLLVKATPGPLPPAFERQGFAYHVVVRGQENGRVVSERHRITCVSGALHPYTDFEGYLARAADPGLKVVVSNTTEAGIVFDPSDAWTDRPAKTFPGKLTQFLRARYTSLGGGPTSALAVLPCELIEKNGQTLKKYVLAHAGRWYADPGFERWLAEDTLWYDTLVDRIVPGHDAGEQARCLAETGIDDELLVVAEPYQLLVIQGPEREDLLPLKKASFPVVWTDDLAPWRTRKVRILNGGHTFLAMVGLGLGVTTVAEALGHPLLGRALGVFYENDVLPFVNFPVDVKKAYQRSVLDRFGNPFVVHKLADIALNSVSKFVARILPGVGDAARSGDPPRGACLVLAALVDRYLNGAGIRDEASVVAAFAEVAAGTDDPAGQAAGVFARREIWGQAEIPPSAQTLATELYVKIRTVGLEAVLREELQRSSGGQA